jgi:hypothetical protein
MVEQIIAVILILIRNLHQNKKGLENPRPLAKKAVGSTWSAHGYP